MGCRFVMDTINENSSRELTMELTDKNGVLIIPEEIIYSIIDEESGQVMLEETTLSQEDGSLLPDQTLVTISLPADINIILDDSNDYENRIIISKWFYNNGNDEENDNYRFRIKNLIGVDKNEFVP
jgi:hypothetical protein